MVLLGTCRSYSAVAREIPIPNHSVDDPEIEKLLLIDAIEKKEAEVRSREDPFCINDMTSVQDLFKARVHMGHKSGMWNPQMLEYIHGIRAGIHIFDLAKTLQHLRRALNVAARIAYGNGVILFVNERSQFDGLVQETARDCGEFFVTPLWRKGILTNSYKLLGTTRYPDLAVILSASKSIVAVTELATSNVPSIAVTDSDSNPQYITYPIPGNDDTPTAVMLYCKLFSKVIQNAKLHRERDITNKKKDNKF